jgi:hypothetical protein
MFSTAYAFTEKEQKDNGQQNNTQKATDLAQRILFEIWG